MPPEDPEAKKKRKAGEQVAIEAAFRQLAILFEAAEHEKLEFNPKPNVPPTANEIRAIRYAYCVLGWSNLKIAKALNKHFRTVNRVIVKRRYEELRQKIDEQMVRNAVTGMEEDVKGVTSLTVAALKRYLTQVVKDPDMKLSVKDAKLISDIGANFHRIFQLIQNKPTAIHASLPAMTEEETRKAFFDVVRKMKEDPMFDPEEFIKSTGITREQFESAMKDANSAASEDFDA